MPRVTTNSTVAVGAYDVCMSPVTTEIAPNREAKASGMTRCERVTMRTGVVWTIFAIVAITMTVEADCVRCGEENTKMVWTREDMGGRRKKVSSLDGEGLWMINRDRDGLDVVLIIRSGTGFYSHGGFSRRRRGQAKGERGRYGNRGVCLRTMEKELFKSFDIRVTLVLW